MTQASETAMRLVWALARKAGGTLRLDAQTAASVPPEPRLDAETCSETGDLIIKAEGNDLV